MSEQLWDEEKRVWYSYDLPKEVEEVKLMEKESKKAAEASGEGVADMELYHVIGVPHDATSAEIKKAYRVQAIKLHPDKNLDDPSANEKFQKLVKSRLDRIINYYRVKRTKSCQTLN